MLFRMKLWYWVHEILLDYIIAKIVERIFLLKYEFRDKEILKDYKLVYLIA